MNSVMDALWVFLRLLSLLPFQWVSTAYQAFDRVPIQFKLACIGHSDYFFINRISISVDFPSKFETLDKLQQRDATPPAHTALDQSLLDHASITLLSSL
uniref:Putative secreted protein n=1 Tax=Anopheles darlingi TaxID=43151 RepID=A0A2M4D6L5_ANODA